MPYKELEVSRREDFLVFRQNLPKLPRRCALSLALRAWEVALRTWIFSYIKILKVLHAYKVALHVGEGTMLLPDKPVKKTLGVALSGLALHAQPLHYALSFGVTPLAKKGFYALQPFKQLQNPFKFPPKSSKALRRGKYLIYTHLQDILVISL